MTGGFNMQDIKMENPVFLIPTDEIRSFLIVAKMELINSIILEDFIAKISILQQQEMFQSLLSRFNPNNITCGVLEAIQVLEHMNDIVVYHGNEVALSMSAAQIELWRNYHDSETVALYLKMAQAYRQIEIDLDKVPKIKRNS